MTTYYEDRWTFGGGRSGGDGDNTMQCFGICVLHSILVTYVLFFTLFAKSSCKHYIILYTINQLEKLEAFVTFP